MTSDVKQHAFEWPSSPKENLQRRETFLKPLESAQQQSQNSTTRIFQSALL